jgi:uroporphyrinogen decarboxylase
MTPRERIKKALNHEEPDRIPVDLGGSIVSSITKNAYRDVRGLLGLSATEPEILWQCSRQYGNMGVIDTKLP